jgi:hypothetical protein
VYRLNYDPDSPSTVMHGFLNLLLAAAWTRAGMKEGETLALLEEQNAAAFEFSDRAVRWRGRQISAAEIAGARREFAVAFGSCSFTEPAAELRALGLI